MKMNIEIKDRMFISAFLPGCGKTTLTMNLIEKNYKNKDDIIVICPTN